MMGGLKGNQVLLLLQVRVALTRGYFPVRQEVRLID